MSKQCFNCKNFLPTDAEYHEVCMATDSDVHILCDDCMSGMVKCQDCDEYLLKYDALKVDDDQFVCDACAESYNKCTNCEGHFSDENFISDSETDVYVCQGCYENNYFTCQDCDHVYHVDAYGEDGHCEECWNENHASSEDEDHEESKAMPNEELLSILTGKEGKEGTPLAPSRYVQSGSLVHFECAVKTFYMLYALEERLHRKRSDLAYMAKKSLATFSSKFARALFDYMAMASIGEARHARYTPAEMMIDGFFPEDNRPDRALVYSSMANTVDPIASAPALSVVFGSDWREKGYGGLKWKSIVDGYATYPNRISDIAFIDMVVNKRHNGSLAFDKGIIFKMPGGQHSVLPFLDFRREHDALDLLTIRDTATFHPITPQLFDLLECAVRERVIPSFHHGIKLIDIRWCQPVEWGDIVLEACENERYETKAEEEEELCDGCDHPVEDCHCEHEDQAEESDQEDKQPEGYYDGKYSEYRKAVKGLVNMEGRISGTP